MIKKQLTRTTTVCMNAAIKQRKTFIMKKKKRVLLKNVIQKFYSSRKQEPLCFFFLNQNKIPSR